MSNSGVNTGFAKCFILFMAVVILLQGCLYLALSVWGIIRRQCSREPTDISSNPFQFAVNLIYFMNEDCGNPAVILSKNSDPIVLNVNFNYAEPVESRTFIFMITYAVISTIWIVTSLTIITTLCGRVTKTINGLCFWPWFLVIMAGCILDAVATGFHIHDLINTTNVDKTFNYLGITTEENVLHDLTNFNAYFITPAVVMTCITSRVILIWFLNIFGSSFCLSLSNSLSKKNSSQQSSLNSLATNNNAPANAVQQQSLQGFAAQMQPSQQDIDPINTDLPSLRIQDIQRQSSTLSQNNESTPSIHSPNSLKLNVQSTVPYFEQSHKTPDRLNYPQMLNSPQYQQQLSPISPLNNRYSTTNESFQFPMQNQRVSEELRGQLPWSYTSILPPVPKKVYPEIPAPDYGNERIN